MRLELSIREIPLQQGGFKTGVYVILNVINGKVYIGSAARGIRRRAWQHLNALRKGVHKSRHLQSAFKKYGEDAFEFVVIEWCSPEECITREQVWLDEYEGADRRYGYNTVPTAGSQLGLVHSGETKEKLSRLTKEQWKRLTPAERLTFGRGMKGKKHTDEIKAVIAAASTGRRHSEETRAKMSAVQKSIGDRNRSPEHRAKLRMAWKLRRLNRPVTDETRAKIAAAHRGKKKSAESRKRMSVAQRGRPKSETTKLKIAATLQGRRLSDIHRQRIKDGMARVPREVLIENGKRAAAVRWGDEV